MADINGRRTPHPPEIDGAAAARLREDHGLTWPAIGRILARRMGRPVAFQHKSVWLAAKPHLRK